MGYRNEERRKVNVLEMKCLSLDKGEMPSSDVDGVNYIKWMQLLISRHRCLVYVRRGVG